MTGLGAQVFPLLLSILFMAVPLGLAIAVFMTLIRIRNAAEDTNRRVAAIEAKLSQR